MAEHTDLISRRTALKTAVALVGGSITVAQLGVLGASFAAGSNDAVPAFLDKERFAALTRIVDIVIPETEVPGAVSAGVPRFIDLLLSGWASAERRQAFLAGLVTIDERARERGAGNFNACEPDKQVQLIRLLDREAFADGAPDSFFRSFKKLVLFAYFSSEPGATQALRFDRIPGDYNPCVPLGEDDREWFWLGYSYGL